MRDLISSDETSLAGCTGGGCLFILLLGWIVSLFLNVGKPPEKPEEPPPPVAGSTVPEGLRIELPEERTSEPPERDTGSERASRRDPDVIPRAAPVRKQEQTLCEMILESVPLVETCDFLDTGTRAGATMFLKVDTSSGSLDEGTAALLALDTWSTIKDETRTPAVVAIETSEGSWMVDRKVLRQCIGRSASSVPCVREEMTRVGIR
jgi:hypothetical protein